MGAMQKIASPQELQAELRRILAYSQGPDRPSREVLASDLRGLADRLAVDLDVSHVKLILEKLAKSMIEPERDVKQAAKLLRRSNPQEAAELEKAEKLLYEARQRVYQVEYRLLK